MIIIYIINLLLGYKFTIGGVLIPAIFHLKLIIKLISFLALIIILFKNYANKISLKVNLIELLLLTMFLLSILNIAIVKNFEFVTIYILNNFTTIFLFYLIGKRFISTIEQFVKLVKTGLFIIITLTFYMIIFDFDHAFRNMNATVDSTENLIGLGGDYIHVHALAFILLVSSVIIFLFENKKTIYSYFLIFTSIFFVVLTLSRAGQILYIFSFIYFMFFISRYKIMTPLISLFLATLLFVYLGDNILGHLTRGASFEDLISGSNRIYIYNEIISHTVSNSFFTGFGFGNLSWDSNEILVNEKYIRSNAHSVYLQIFSGLGIIGLFITFFIILLTYLKIINIRDKRFNLIFYLILFTGLVQNSFIGSPTPLQPLVFLCLGIIMNPKINSGLKSRL